MFLIVYAINSMCNAFAYLKAYLRHEHVVNGDITPSDLSVAMIRNTSYKYMVVVFTWRYSPILAKTTLTSR